jgi:hypothetical protein
MAAWISARPIPARHRSDLEAEHHRTRSRQPDRATCGTQRGTHGIDHRSAHVGYFLIDKGLPELERATQMQRSLCAIAGRIARKAPLALYLGTIFVIAVAVTVGIIGHTERNDGLSWTAAVLLMVGASHLGVGLVNWLATLLVRPHRLPRLDVSEGIPPEFRTLVAVPTMLISPRNVGRLLKRWSALSRQPGCELAFLFTDRLSRCAQQAMPEDESLLQLAQAGIEALKKYRDDQDAADTFFCCTVRAAGILKNKLGWATSANAANLAT